MQQLLKVSKAFYKAVLIGKRLNEKVEETILHKKPYW